MKVGDLVRYIEIDGSHWLGIIIDAHDHSSSRRYKILFEGHRFTTTWWDAHRLEMVL